MLDSTPSAELFPEHLKIFTTADAVGGVWRYCVDLASALSRTGAEIMVATLGPRPSDAQRHELLSIPRAALVTSDYALEWMPDPWRDVDISGEWLLDLQSSFKADVIHLNSYSHASLPWAKPIVITAHSCVYSWWRAVHGNTPGSEWNEYRTRVAAGLSCSDIVVAPSHHIAGEMCSEYGASADKIRVIHNFTNVPAASDTKKQPFILAAGRMWDPAKNLELLDRIAPKLYYEIRVAGPGSPGQSARFLGSLPHAKLMDQMSAAAIFVHPALYEPFGLSVLEAARAGCCLVLSNIPSLRELWDGAAIFLDPHEPDAWVRELNRLSSNYQERKTLGRLAQSHSARYSASASVKQYLNVYASLVGSMSGVAA
jgi:glycogen(starch) synthase